MKDFDYKGRLESLKFKYSGVISSLRIKVIEDRVRDPNCGPNKLILQVSATEGMARTILIKLFMDREKLEPAAAFLRVDGIRSTKKVFEAIYQYKEKKANQIFESEDWKRFEWAIQYRNFLIHHCAFVGGAVSNRLIKATVDVRKSLKHEWL